MKIDWPVLVIKAVTDAVITAGTALTSAMVASEVVAIPSIPVWILAAVGAAMAAARTIQQTMQAVQATENMNGVLPPKV
jgi:hypothetical protein